MNTIESDRQEASVESNDCRAWPDDYGQAMANIRRDFDLSRREARFVMEMAVDGNASAAYVRAGYSAKNADSNSARMTVKDSIKAALERVRAQVAEKIGFEAEDALRMVADILRADPRELVEYHVGCCRCCHGAGHLYQRTAAEMARDRAKHDAQVQRRIERNKDYEASEFDEAGGIGFDRAAPPNPACPECAGEGVGRVVINDTRHLSREAAALYVSVKEGKDGVEVKMHDKVALLDKMFRFHGLYEVDNRQKAAQATDPAALVALSEAMDRSRMERQAVMARRAQSGFTGD
jgi:phage terminase small subunit